MEKNYSLFNPENNEDLEVLKILKNVAKQSGKEINKIGIKRKRPNEVGNNIETFVKNALVNLGYKANTPKTISVK